MNQLTDFITEFILAGVRTFTLLILILAIVGLSVEAWMTYWKQK